MMLTWPDVPWRLLTGICAAVTLLVPALVYPFTKLGYLAIDLAFRPPESHDLFTPHERQVPTSDRRGTP